VKHWQLDQKPFMKVHESKPVTFQKMRGISVP